MKTRPRGSRIASRPAVGALLDPLEPRRMLAAELVKDLDPTGAHGVPQDQMMAYGGELYFIGEDVEHGPELWRSDGTEAGTRLVKEVVPGSEGVAVRGMAVANGLLFFLDTYRRNLWRSDGTEAGNFGAGTALGDAVFFTARVNGVAQLWKSDGTEAGTVPVTDLPGIATEMVAGNGRFFMVVSNESWVSDGTAAGTQRLSGLTDVRQLTVVGDALYFSGRTAPDHSPWLWKSDGTAAGTTTSVGNNPHTGIFDHIGGQLFFVASTWWSGPELWRTDGTHAGTRMVKEIVPGVRGVEIHIRDGTWTRLGDLLLAQIYDGSEWRVWRTDGTAEGTFALPVPANDWWGTEPAFAVAGGQAYFRNRNGDLYRTDGTVEGTSKLEWEPPGWDLSEPSNLMAVNGTVLLTASSREIGTELWRLGPPTMPATTTITGTAGDDRWEVGDVGGGRIGVWVDGRSRNEAPDFEFAAAEVAELRFVGLDGDDALSFNATTAVPIEFDGGTGADRLTVTGNDLTLRTRGLMIDAQDHLDLDDNTLVVQGGDLAAVEALVAAGRNGATHWAGNGIRSTAAANNALTGLAVERDGDNVVVKYTYNGDANVDGRVNADDYFRIDQGFLAQPPNATYAQGDFNYDGTINADDYFLIDQAFLGQSALAPEATQATVTTRTQASALNMERKPKRGTTVRPPRVY